MKFLFKINYLCLAFALCCLNSSMFGIIIQATLLEKKLDNGTTQQVYLFGDYPSDFSWLDVRLTAKDKIEQKQLLSWAVKNKLDAWIITKDKFYDSLGNDPLYTFLTFLSRTTQSITNHILSPDSCTNFLCKRCIDGNLKFFNLEDHYHDGNCKNTNLILASTTPLILMTNEAFHNFLFYFQITTGIVLVSAITGMITQEIDYLNTMNTSPHKDKLYACYSSLKSWSDTIKRDITRTMNIIWSNPTQSTFFVCINRHTAYCLQNVLQQDGFTCTYQERDEVYSASSGARVDAENVIDIDMFMEKVHHLPKIKTAEPTEHIEVDKTSLICAN